ncbi:hypothetical protein D3C81_2121060 [compost metagenome]
MGELLGMHPTAQQGLVKVADGMPAIDARRHQHVLDARRLQGFLARSRLAEARVYRIQLGQYGALQHHTAGHRP